MCVSLKIMDILGGLSTNQAVGGDGGLSQLHSIPPENLVVILSISVHICSVHLLTP